MKWMALADSCICCGGQDLWSAPAVLMPFVADRALGQKPVEISADWGLRDLRAGTAHTLCHSLQCPSCGVLFLDYRFTPGQMSSLYHDYRGADYTRQRDEYEPGYAATVALDYRERHPYIAQVEQWLLTHFSDLPRQPRILDWGGGDGSNTPFLGHALVHVHDIAGTTLVAGAEPANVSTKATDAGGYDLLVCMQVLEHVADPLTVLQELLPFMQEKTLLYLEVPYEKLLSQHSDGINLTSYKRHWHEHVNFFTRQSLLELTRRAGLRMVDGLLLCVENGYRQGQVQGLLLAKEPRS